ncbi:MAG: ATP-binding cassette domain-containing protein, partial [Promethearchaeota archaeon]
MIVVKDVEYTYPNGTLALKDINLNIYKGETVGIMGKNGAGKTTLIRTFN